MARDIILPQLAMGMSEGTIAEWLVKEGTEVARDQPLVSIETEKVATEIPAPASGYVHIVAQSGQKVPVETIIATISGSVEEYRRLYRSENAGAGMGPHPSVAVAGKNGAPAGSRALDMYASQRLRASGVAKALAKQRGIDLCSLVGTGPQGRIVKRDVEAASMQLQRAAAPLQMTSKVPDARHDSIIREKARIPLSGARKVIAERMMRAVTTAAETFIFFEVDIARLIAARNVLLSKEKEIGARVSLLAFYARALALACKSVPICNSTLAENEIVVWDTVNVGIAVALPGTHELGSNLVVPIVRDIGNKGILEIYYDIHRQVARARAGELTPADMQGGTITISSTQGFLPGSWMVSTPHLNLPQVVNFQPGTPIERPVVANGQISIGTVLPCGFTYDHRCMDGEPVARFIRQLTSLLRDPETMLL
jgi:pyruvate/2-oxoglutarate dehydrogenase complex dihydrolipoamide acyltransferase (E2) component